MKSPAVLHFVAGLGLVVILAVCLVGVDGKKVEEKKELSKPETNNAIQKPNLMSFFRRLLPEKTLNQIRAAVASTVRPKAKSIPAKDTKSRDLKSKKKPVKITKSKVVPTIITKKATQPTTRLRTAVNPKTTTTKKVKVAPKVTKQTKVKPPQVRKQKKGKELRSRQNSKTSFAAFNKEDGKGPAPEEMQVLTHDQKRNRLRQELVRETEDNCLAKILCGTGSKPKPKEKNTLVSDTAYLIKEFFNIFDAHRIPNLVNCE